MVGYHAAQMLEMIVFIARPKSFVPDYAVDKRYASDRLQLSRAYINIEKELRSIFKAIPHRKKCQIPPSVI